MTKTLAIKLMLGALAGISVFHLLVLVKIIPYTIAWGGRLNNDNEMYVFETISLMVNLFLSFVLLIKGSFVRPMLSQTVLNIVLWVFIVLFLLNTLGNIFAKTDLEKLFALVTFAFSVLLWIVVKKERPKSE